MSDSETTNNDESRVRRENKPGLFRFRNVAGLALIGVVGLAGYQAFQDTSILGISRLSKTAKIDDTPAGKQLADSERYKKSLQTANEQGAENARNVGESFIPTADEALRDIDQKPAAIKKNEHRPLPPSNDVPIEGPQTVVIRQPKQQPQRQPAVPSQPKGPDYSRIEQLAKAMVDQQQGLIAAWDIKPSKSEIIIEQDLYQTPKATKVGASSADGKPLLDANGQPLNLTVAQLAAASKFFGTNGSKTNNVFKPPLLRAGDVVLASTIITNDSDTPGPVIAEVRKGPLKGARLIGSYEKNQNNTHFIIKFAKGVTAEGKEIDVDAYAVDARQKSLAVRTDINRRILQRYAPRIAAAFVTGLGDALSNTGSQAVSLGGGAVGITSPAATFRQGVYKGLSKVGEDLADEFVQNAPKGPLITLRNRQIIGVLFIANVNAPK